MRILLGIATRPDLCDDVGVLKCIISLGHSNFIELMGRLCAALVTPDDDNPQGVFIVCELS